jgi:hypothetical protein
MNKHSGRSRSRGEKMTQSRDPVIVHGTQRTENDTADPKLRNKAQTWKANEVPTREATLNSPKSREGSPSTNLRSSTPKTTSSELNPVGLPRFASTGSAKKNATPMATNSTSNNVGFRRSASDSSGIKEKSLKRSSNIVEHKRPSSNKTKKNSRRSPSPTPLKLNHLSKMTILKLRQTTTQMMHVQKRNCCPKNEMPKRVARNRGARKNKGRRRRP